MGTSAVMMVLVGRVLLGFESPLEAAARASLCASRGSGICSWAFDDLSKFGERIIAVDKLHTTVADLENAAVEFG